MYRAYAANSDVARRPRTNALNIRRKTAASFGA
jgi:hypothetical protein